MRSLICSVHTMRDCQGPQRRGLPPPSQFARLNGRPSYLEPKRFDVTVIVALG
jgi:hypothetical protein